MVPWRQSWHRHIANKLLSEQVADELVHCRNLPACNSSDPNTAEIVVQWLEQLVHINWARDDAPVDGAESAHVLEVLVLDKLAYNVQIRLNLEHFKH